MLQLWKFPWRNCCCNSALQTLSSERRGLQDAIEGKSAANSFLQRGIWRRMCKVFEGELNKAGVASLYLFSFNNVNVQADPRFSRELHLDLLISVCLCEDAILACCYTGKFQLLLSCCVRWYAMNTPSYRFNPKWSSAHNFNRRKLATCTSIAPCVSTVDWCFLILQVTPMHYEFLCGYNGHKWYRLHTHKQKIRMTSMKLANT